MKDKVNVVMDASQYDLFRLCEQRFDYRYNHNKSLPIKAKPLDRGTLVHVACETYYESLKSGAKYDYAVGAALLKVREAGVVTSDLDVSEINRIVEVMEEYFEYWQVADQNIEIVAVEQPFIYLLHEDDEVCIHMAGKIDLIYNDNKDTNMPLDHKSTDRNAETGRMSNQFKNYCRAIESNYLIVDKIGFQKSLKPHEKFLRVPLSYDHLVLDEWRDNTVKVIKYYLQCVEKNEWPLNETSCDKYNRKCEYYDVCDSSGKEAKAYKLEANYITIDPWDVSKALTKASETISNLQAEAEAKAKAEREEDGSPETHT